METNLKNKTVVITGAGAGIGLAITKAFAGVGAKVVAGDLDISDLTDEAIGMAVKPVEVDLSTEIGPSKLIESAVDEFGALDILINNVGIFPFREGFLTVTDEDWQNLLSVNFFSMVRACRAAIPHMIRNNSGVITNIASDIGRAPDPFFVDYGVSKAAMLSLSKTISIEFGPAGIRSNCVSPGPTRTLAWDKPGGFADSLAKEYNLDREAAIAHFISDVRKMPLEQIGNAEDVAAAVLFVSSDLARQITGADIHVDGGLVAAV